MLYTTAGDRRGYGPPGGDFEPFPYRDRLRSTLKPAGGGDTAPTEMEKIS